MKKIIIVLIVAALCFGIVSCGNSNKTENLNGISYEYSDDAIRDESFDGISYYYGSDDIEQSEYIISVSWNEFDNLLYSDPLEEIYSNKEFLESTYDVTSTDNCTIDGNNADIINYNVDSNAPCQTILMSHNDYILEITAYGIEDSRCVKEVEMITSSMTLG